MNNCATCGKPLELSSGQKYKAKWGQKVFYHDGCQLVRPNISVTKSKQVKYIYES